MRLVSVSLRFVLVRVRNRRIANANPSPTRVYTVVFDLAISLRAIPHFYQGYLLSSFGFDSPSPCTFFWLGMSELSESDAAASAASAAAASSASKSGSKGRVGTKRRRRGFIRCVVVNSAALAAML